MKVYAVQCYSGQYEDYHEWIYRDQLFKIRDKAEQVVLELDRKRMDYIEHKDKCSRCQAEIMYDNWDSLEEVKSFVELRGCNEHDISAGYTQEDGTIEYYCSNEFDYYEEDNDGERIVEFELED